MATKEELVNENAVLRQKVADLEAAGGGGAEETALLREQVADLSAQVQVALEGATRADAWIAWLAAHNLTVQMVEGEALLCDPDGLPIDGVIVDGLFSDREVTFDDKPGGIIEAPERPATVTVAARVREADGQFAEPREGEIYRYDGSGDLLRVEAGETGDLLAKIEMLETDKLNARARIEELRENVAAMQRRLEPGLHGRIDDLKPVV